MRLFISSSSARFLMLIAIIVAIATGLEAYCRKSPQYAPITYFFLRHALESDPTNAVFGDSHVLTTSRIPDFSFYGWAGEQPEEFETLVQYLYAHHTPKKIIVQADPQWFGEYHKTREKFILPENLIDQRFPSVLTSRYYQLSLKRNLLNSGEAIASGLLFPQPAAAETTAELAGRAEKHWAELFSKPDFNWSWMPDDERGILTWLRVQAQNPRSGFETSTSARAFENALSGLAQHGAEVCLFRTPVTRLYLETTARLPDTRYRDFDTYIVALANRLHMKHVDFRSLPFDASDAAFSNSDHLTDAKYDKLWPLAAKSCFDH